DGAPARARPAVSPHSYDPASGPCAPFTSARRPRRTAMIGARPWVLALMTAAVAALAAPPVEAAPKPEGTLTVAVATFGDERWLPRLYVGAEDVVLKPMYENLLTRDPKTGELAPMLAERWQVLDGGKTWKFQIRKGVQFHGGRGELTAE